MFNSFPGLNVKLFALRDTARPREGPINKVTVPANLLIPVTLMSEWPTIPGASGPTVNGVAETMKSGARTVIV